jgi:hypothetical protein
MWGDTWEIPAPFIYCHYPQTDTRLPSTCLPPRYPYIGQHITCRIVGKLPLTILLFTGPANHLAKITPATAGSRRASPLTIQGFLCRSGLPIETIALAACVVNALSSHFEQNWREAWTSTYPEDAAQVHQTQTLREKYPIVLSPEVIVLAALSIASSFNEDRHWRALHWTRTVSDGFCTLQEFNTTTRCILEDINYGMHAFTPEAVEQMKKQMQEQFPPQNKDSELDSFAAVRPKLEPLKFKGIAVIEHGLMTPEAER